MPPKNLRWKLAQKMANARAARRQNAPPPDLDIELIVDNMLDLEDEIVAEVDIGDGELVDGEEDNYQDDGVLGDDIQDQAVPAGPMGGGVHVHLMCQIYVLLTTYIPR